MSTHNEGGEAIMRIGPAGAGAAGAGAPGAGPAGMSYAKALTDARALIVQQSARIKSDAQKMKAHADEIAQLRSTVDSLTSEVERLRALEPRLADAAAGREQAESLACRQRLEIESLETASRELQRMLGEQAGRINELLAEVEQLRAGLPTDEDAAALEQMTALLNSARAGAKARQQRTDQRPDPRAEQHAEQPAAPAPRGLDRNAGPAMAQEHHERLEAAARRRAITIPAEPTPFCLVTERQAA